MSERNGTPPTPELPTPPPAQVEALFGRARAGDLDALEKLIAAYRPMVLSLVREAQDSAASNPERMTEAHLGFLRAIRDYRGRDAEGFTSFAHLCVANELRTLVRAARRRQGAFDRLFSADRAGEEGAIDLGEGAGMVPNWVAHSLSSLELTVLRGYLRGLSYRALCEETGRSAKCVDNALQRVRRKVEAILSDTQ